MLAPKCREQALNDHDLESPISTPMSGHLNGSDQKRGEGSPLWLCQEATKTEQTVGGVFGILLGPTCGLRFHASYSPRCCLFPSSLAAWAQACSKSLLSLPAVLPGTPGVGLPPRELAAKLTACVH